MDGQEPLLSNGDVENFVQTKKTTSLIVCSLKWILKIVIWLLFIAWVSLIFLYPINAVNDFISTLINDGNATFLGISGPMFLIYSGPILIIAFLSIPYLIISGKQQLKEKNNQQKRPSYRLSTFPLLVDGPLGVVTAAELIGILLFVLYVIWAVYVYAVHGVEIASAQTISFAFQIAGVSFAYIGIFIVAFLFIPIARGSIILRLTNIPFGHAARYHIWLGHLTVLIFTLHGLCYMTVWLMEGLFLQEILAWKDTGVANLAGVIGLLSLAGIWVTSLPPVRKLYFEVFYYTHHLYIVFIIFLALHVGVIPFGVVAGSILLFMLDRFLRFCQSRHTVDIVSATSFPGGIVKLVLTKPKNLPCDALSLIFIRVPELSWLQWHPFSVSLGDENHISVLIKAVGEWTTKINEKILSVSAAEPQERLHLQPNSKLITASIEGPYGHELPHHLMYEKLVLVAGGIGISPFLAVLSDIFHRFRQGKPCLLKNIIIVWAIKRSNELALLSTIDLKSICRNISNQVNLDILIYVTRESEPPLEEGIIEKAIDCFSSPVSSRRSISVLTAGTGNNLWFGIYLISATIGFVILMILLNIFFINPNDIPTGWFQGLLFLTCMVASVFIFGGLVVGLWHLQERKFSQVICDNGRNRMDHITQSDEPAAANKALYHDLDSFTKILYGSRPNFKEIFESISERWGCFDVGVIICGPSTLESSVAKECRSLNTRKGPHHPIFHFHNHNFYL